MPQLGDQLFFLKVSVLEVLFQSDPVALLLEACRFVGVALDDTEPIHHVNQLSLVYLLGLGKPFLNQNVDFSFEFLC